MEEKELAFHCVCTRDAAMELVKAHDRFWVANCGCRENRGKCERSRMDICLMFRGDFPYPGSGRKEISGAEVEEIFQEAEEKHLVTRPFRNEEDKVRTDGICFCCDDCCAYFVKPAENKCDVGDHIESTDLDECNNCGECVDICYFGARKLVDEELVVNRAACYGCGLCAEFCPEDCIQMVRRNP